MATVSEDKTVKLWKFEPEKGDFSIQYNCNMHETPLAVDIHPLSIQMAVGSKESLKIYYVLYDEPKLVFSEIYKTCMAVKYSEGGHLLAAAN